MAVVGTPNETATDGTGAGLDAFLQWAADKGELNASTASAYRTTIKRVLSIEGEWESVDVRHLDVESLLDRFETKNRTKYSVSSMRSYRTRFSQAVLMYNAYLDKDRDWKALTVRRVRSARPSRPQSVRPDRSASSQVSTGGPVPTPGAGHQGERQITHHLPLRPGVIVRLDLPVDLDETDADRIAGFARALAFTRTAAPSPEEVDQ